MKLTLSLFVLCMFITLPVLGQSLELDTLRIETNEKKWNWDHIAKKIKISESIFHSDNQIEIRFFMKIAGANEGDFVIFTYDGNKFHGQRGYFILKLTKDSRIKNVKIKNKEKFTVQDTDKFWASLVSNNIHSLPDQSMLDGRMKKLIKVDENGKKIYERLMVADGGTYDLELKVNDNYRFIYYSNPCTSADYFTDIEELRNFCQINKILNRK